MGNPKVSMLAGREALKRITQALDARASFGQESTMSSQQPINTLRKANAAGYQTQLVYIGVDSKETSIARVNMRVQAGGHDIPLAALQRRYDKSLANLPRAMSIAQNVLIYDNQIRYKLVYERVGDQEIYQAPEMLEWATKAIAAYQAASPKS